MRPAPAAGDLALTARPAAADTFAAYGRLLGPGDAVQLGQSGGVVAVLEEARKGPRRFLYAQRHPEAQRLLIPLGEASFVVLVLGAGDPPAGPPVAFRTPAGQGLLINAGVWHAGPVPLEDGSICEILETRGPADRMDRRPLSELTGVEGVRVQLPEEPGARGPGLDLESPGALLVDDALARRAAIGLLLLEQLDVPIDVGPVTDEHAEVVRALQALGGGGTDLGSMAGVAEMRRLWRILGLDPLAERPPYEQLLASAVAGRGLPAPNRLEAVIQLLILRHQLALFGYDAGRVASPLQLRFGVGTERIETSGGRRVPIEGVPVLCDTGGPFGSLVGTAPRCQIGPSTHRALLVLHLPLPVDEGQVLSHLEEVSRVVRRYCGGREAGHLVLRPPDSEDEEPQSG